LYTTQSINANATKLSQKNPEICAVIGMRLGLASSWRI